MMDDDTGSLPAATEVPIRVSDWGSAARAGDWLAVAAGIDALPEAERSEPGARYVRALAAHRLDDCESVLRVTSGLAKLLPLLHTEIDVMDRECELVLGLETPSGDWARVSPERRLKAARIATRTGELQRAGRILDELCEDLGQDVRGSLNELVGKARELRAQVAERLGLLERAELDYRWLALSRVSPGADTAYERLAGKRLSSSARLMRAETLAKRGLIEEVDRELELAVSSLGTTPTQLALVRTRALAHYSSRASYREAALLYEEAARISSGARASDLLRAASAWVRSGELERAVAAYERIRRQYPRSAAEERALYRKAQALYAAGRWDAAVEAYTTYLERYSGVQAARFVRASLYERSVAELARGNAAAALSGFERLRRHRRMGYPSQTIAQLEAVALASSGVGTLESQAVQRFEKLATHHPLSFVALASAARLKRMGREPPRLPNPPRYEASGPRPALPSKVQLLLDLGLYTAAERALYQAEAGLRAEYPERAAETLCEHYSLLDRGFRRFALAAGAVGRGTLERAPTASNAWAWQCLYPQPFAAVVKSLERRHELPEGLIHSVMRQESAFHPDARSPAGAVGLMQLMPRTAELAAHELGIEHHGDRLKRPSYNLELGAFYLSKLMRTFQERAAVALASYNAGPHAAARWLAGGSELDLDLWVARIPYAETRRYVTQVMTNWGHYRYLSGGFEQVPELSLELPSNIELKSDDY